MRALSTRNDDPKHASRPFDLERDGFVIGEGSGLVILEELEFANAEANILAEIVGYGMSGDAFHVTMPDETGSGAIRVCSEHLKDAGLAPEQIGYINAHGTSTPYNDKFETLAIKKVFGEHAYNIPVSSTKSMTGHALGAAGGIEPCFSVMVLTRKTAADDQLRISRSGLRSGLHTERSPETQRSIMFCRTISALAERMRV